MSCCKEFHHNAAFYGTPVGGGLLYPPEMRPTAQIEQDSTGAWNVNGCCGGGCYVLQDIKRCPWCGAVLPKLPDPTKKGAHRE